MIAALLLTALLSQPCHIAFLAENGEVTAFPAHWCYPAPVMRITATAIEIDNAGQIIVLRLPSGWGLGTHLIAYTIGEGKYLIDGEVHEIFVRGW